MKKKVVAMLLAGVMVFSLAACGGNASDDADSDDGDEIVVDVLDDGDDTDGADAVGDEPNIIEIVAKGSVGTIPEIFESPMNPRTPGGYPWLAEVVELDEDEVDELMDEHGAFEIGFTSATLDEDTITWTRYEIDAPEDMKYGFFSYFDGDKLIRGDFNSLWLPLEYGDEFLARYLLFAEDPGTITLTTYTYTFRDWEELTSVLGLHPEMEDTAAQNPGFPTLPIGAPENGWVREPWESTVDIVFAD